MEHGRVHTALTGRNCHGDWPTCRTLVAPARRIARSCLASPGTWRDGQGSWRGRSGCGTGERVPDEVLDKLAQASAVWHRDAAALGMALSAVGAAEVPDLTLAEALEVDEEEADALTAMVEGYEVELNRQMLQEGERNEPEDES